MDLYLCQHLLPVASPPVSGGAAVAVADGRIVAAGAPGRVQEAIASRNGDDGPVREHDLGNSVLLPGLINTHTHLELSWMGKEDLVQGDYIPWLRSLLEIREARESDADVEGCIKEGIDFMIRRGTAAVGDISNTLATVLPLAESSLRGIIFHEIYGMDKDQGENIMTAAAEALSGASRELEDHGGLDRFRLALTPHGAHTVSPALLKALAGRANASKAPLSIHLAETQEEVQQLQTGDGVMREFYRERNFTDENWNPPKLSPVAHMDRLGALSARTLAVHCVHLDRQDLARLQERRCTVVTCPRSNRRLNVGKADVPTIMGAGVPVALGTDSLASAPDLDMFAEMKALREEHPGLAPAAVLRMATLNGARALGLEDDLGSIEPGKLPMFIQVPLPSATADPLEIVTSCPDLVTPIQHCEPQEVGGP
jgi:cytosine/adenosine deaminase-related metal-dependent hydrolase